MNKQFLQLPSWLAPGKARPQIQDSQEVDRLYKKIRPRLMLAVTVGYAFFYPCRLAFNVIKEPLIDNGIFSAVELGWIGAVALISYAFGKLINGFLADRLNVRAFITLGLAMSALINLAMGCVAVIWIMVVLWAVNSLFQGTGGPGSVVSFTRWFPAKQRGTMYGIWSTAHAMGEGLTYLGVAAIVSATVWNAAFWAPGIACLAISVAMYLGLRDRPETLGLPPVEIPVNPLSNPCDSSEIKLSLQTQLILLKRPAFWALGLSAALMYVTRYAVNSWGMLYLQKEHDFSLLGAGGLIGLNTITGIAGCVAYGFISDRFFKSRRPPLTLLFGIVEILSLCLIFYGPKGNIIIMMIGLVFYGFTLSGILAVLGGLFAVDIAPKKAAGAAMGLIGMFSYVGAGIQELLSGALIQSGTTIEISSCWIGNPDCLYNIFGMVGIVRHYDFSIPILCWIGASVLSAVLAASLWRVKTT